LFSFFGNEKLTAEHLKDIFVTFGFGPLNKQHKKRRENVIKETYK